MRRSYSQWSTYKQCGAKYDYQYIQKLPRPKESSPAMERGLALHDQCEQFMLGKTDELPTEHLHKWFHDIRDRYGDAVEPERKFLLSEDWETADEDGAALTGFIDLRVPQGTHTLLAEYKTGGVYDEHEDQRHLYAMAELAEHSGVGTVEVVGVYLDKNKIIPSAFSRNDFERGKYIWRERFRQMDNPISHIPTPSFKCGWCPFRKAVGGPCKFGAD